MKEKEPSVSPLAKIFQGKVEPFAYWTNEQRGAPNPIIRGALFSALTRSVKREMLNNEHIVTLDGVDLIYTGPRLDQHDLDTWLNVVHLMNKNKTAETLEVTTYAYLKSIDKSVSTTTKQAFLASLKRLKNANLDLKFKNGQYWGSLIDEVLIDETKSVGLIEIKINKRIQALFQPTTFTKLDWNVRKSLESKPLAQWLHAFYSSHKSPFPYSIKKIKELCGNNTADIHKFKQLLRRAAQQVTNSFADQGEVVVFLFEDDLIKCHKADKKKELKA